MIAVRIAVLVVAAAVAVDVRRDTLHRSARPVILINARAAALITPTVNVLPILRIRIRDN